MALGGYVAIFAGELAKFPDRLVEDYQTPGQHREFVVAHNWYMVDHEWPLFLFRYAEPDPASRRGALDLSWDCVSFLSEVGPLQSRASTLLGIYDRVRESEQLLQYHVSMPYLEVARLWRQSLLTEAEHAVFPEIGGWGAALRWSYQGLEAAHDRLLQTTSGGEPLPEVIAAMALCGKVLDLPAGLAVAVGPDRFAEISAAFEQRRPGFDAAEWLSRNRGWLARGMLAGEIDTCRAWLAMATQVAMVVAAYPARR